MTKKIEKTLKMGQKIKKMSPIIKKSCSVMNSLGGLSGFTAQHPPAPAMTRAKTGETSGRYGNRRQGRKEKLSAMKSNLKPLAEDSQVLLSPNGKEVVPSSLLPGGNGSKNAESLSDGEDCSTHVEAFAGSKLVDPLASDGDEEGSSSSRVLGSRQLAEACAAQQQALDEGSSYNPTLEVDPTETLFRSAGPACVLQPTMPAFGQQQTTSDVWGLGDAMGVQTMPALPPHPASLGCVFSVGDDVSAGDMGEELGEKRPVLACSGRRDLDDGSSSDGAAETVADTDAVLLSAANLAAGILPGEGLEDSEDETDDSSSPSGSSSAVSPVDENGLPIDGTSTVSLKSPRVERVKQASSTHEIVEKALTPEDVARAIARRTPSPQSKQRKHGERKCQHIGKGGEKKSAGNSNRSCGESSHDDGVFLSALDGADDVFATPSASSVGDDDGVLVGDDDGSSTSNGGAHLHSPSQAASLLAQLDDALESDTGKASSLRGSKRSARQGNGSKSAAGRPPLSGKSGRRTKAGKHSAVRPDTNMVGGAFDMPPLRRTGHVHPPGVSALGRQDATRFFFL